jgi:hypothetical protein
MSERNISAELPSDETKSVLHLPVHPETIVLVQESTGAVWVRADMLYDDGFSDRQNRNERGNYNWINITEKPNQVIRFY